METVADRAKPTAIRTDLRAIFVSLELSRSRWLITSLSPGNREKMSKHSVHAGDIAGMLARFSELRNKTQARTGQSFPIVVIQEAGLDGFWIHRVLRKEGIESHVVDPASIATSRRRRLCRERKVLIAERVQPVNRIKGLLFAQGVSEYEPLRRDRRERLAGLVTGDGRLLPNYLKAQISRELDRLPTPWQSGSVDREQGVSKAGNPRLRETMIQLAWLWRRHQPRSVLTLWFEERVRHNAGRLKKRTIVALARKLLVALWKHVSAGIVIEGAAIKTA